MEKLARLFGRSIRFAYHCFDRIVIRGYLSALSRPENIVYFFRTIKQVACISKETPSSRSPIPTLCRPPPIVSLLVGLRFV